MRVLAFLALVLFVVHQLAGATAALYTLEAIAWAGFLLAGVAWYLSVTDSPTHRRKP